MTDHDEPCGSDCDQALAHLWEYLDAELADLDAGLVRRHLDECSGCLSEYQIEVVLKRVVRRGCAEHAPESLRVRIHQQITLRGTELG